MAPPFVILSKAVSASSRTAEYVAGKSSIFGTASGYSLRYVYSELPVSLLSFCCCTKRHFKLGVC